MNIHAIKRSLLSLGGIFVTSTLAHGQIENGLLNYWPLDGDASDVASDIPGSSGATTDNGVVNGTASFDAGLFGDAVSLDGAQGNNITVPDGIGSEAGGVANDIDRTASSVSISVWVKATAWSTSWQGIVAHGEQSDYRIARRGEANPVLLAYAGGVGDIQTTTSYGASPDGDGLWHHIVAISENGVSTRLWVDGVLEATGGAPSIAQSNANNNVLCFGCNPDNGREFNGLIDDIAMWDRAITDQEVTDIFNAGQSGQALSSFFSDPDDTDGDGLPDTWEVRYGLDPDDNGSVDVNNGAAGDPDLDNVSNIDEFNNRTFPNDDDSDDDNLKDGVETNNGENSYVDENDTGTNPLSADSDGDGINDGAEDNGGTYVSETQTGTNPTIVDTDSDTMPDGYEVNNSLDPTTDDGALDPDTDELSNLGEFTAGSDPQVADTDMDGLNDGPEVSTHTTSPIIADTDGDALSDGDEVNVHATDPNDIDTDGDLFSDGKEIAEGGDPRDFNNTPSIPAPLLYYSFNVENGTEVENLGTTGTAGTHQGVITYGESKDDSFGTAFVGNRNDLNDSYVATGLAGDLLGLASDDKYTAMAWIKWDGSAGQVDHMVFGQDDGDGNNPQLHHGIRDDSPVNIHFGGWGGPQDISDAGTVPIGEWTHVAWQYDGDEKIVFVNGIESARATGNNITNSALNVIIGAHGRDATGLPSHSFNGSIDEVKIYGTDILESQMEEAMQPGASAGGGLVITATSFDPTVGANGQYSVTFNSRSNKTYTLAYSTDLFDWGAEIDDGIVGQDETTTVTFPHPEPGVTQIFFRIGEN